MERERERCVGSYNNEKEGEEKYTTDRHKQVLSPLSGECHLNPVDHKPSLTTYLTAA